MAKVLKGLGLAAIVRDEGVNPAGGVVEFVELTMPYVEGGVIVDTGSRDKTPELLKKMARKYPNLKVVSAKFNGFADARNVSLREFRKLKIKRALILDADERLTEEDYAKLGEHLNRFSAEIYRFEVLDIFPDGVTRVRPVAERHPSRVFSMKIEPNFHRAVWEHLEYSHYPEVGTHYTDIEIKHFVPFECYRMTKNYEWYDLINQAVSAGRPIPTTAPSETKGFASWKTPHPQKIRDKYR